MYRQTLASFAWHGGPLASLWLTIALAVAMFTRPELTWYALGPLLIIQALSFVADYVHDDEFCDRCVDEQDDGQRWTLTATGRGTEDLAPVEVYGTADVTRRLAQAYRVGWTLTFTPNDEGPLTADEVAAIIRSEETGHGHA